MNSLRLALIVVHSFSITKHEPKIKVRKVQRFYSNWFLTSGSLNFERYSLTQTSNEILVASVGLDLYIQETEKLIYQQALLLRPKSQKIQLWLVFFFWGE